MSQHSKRNPKLGTRKNPGVVDVKTKKRMKKIASILKDHGWEYIIESEKPKPEKVGKKWVAMTLVHIQSSKPPSELAGYGIKMTKGMKK